jgi:hypothetical protein
LVSFLWSSSARYPNLWYLPLSKIKPLRNCKRTYFGTFPFLSKAF